MLHVHYTPDAYEWDGLLIVALRGNDTMFRTEIKMPIYEYYCESCGETNEHLVFPWSQEDSMKCKSCSDQNIRKLVSRFSFKSPSDNLNWLPSKETLSDVDHSDAGSMANHLNRIRQAKNG